MHIPVLLKETIELLNPQPNENFIDCTVGEAGHTIAILQKTAPGGKVLGIDLDVDTIDEAKKKTKIFGERIILVQDNFQNLENITERYNFKNISGILFDIGMSSRSIEISGRGFSFLKDEPLLMNYGGDALWTAGEIVNKWAPQDLEELFTKYGEERFSKSIAKKIVEVRKEKPIKTTFDLVEIVKSATPSFYHHRKIHPATLTFQAIRMAVNNELNSLIKGLEGAMNILEDGGRLGVISFHSLEDRIVKNFFRDKKGQLEILTKKPIIPSVNESYGNPRSRSAKLRVAVLHKQ